MHLIDIGANLTHDSFDRDRDAVLDRARQAGVVQMVITGASRVEQVQENLGALDVLDRLDEAVVARIRAVVEPGR